MTAEPEFSLIIGFGSDMGNAEDAAMTFAEVVEEALSISATAIELNQVEAADLRSATHLIVACSTWGEGEFPDNGSLFWEAISADGADRLDHLRFAVLALGDSGYDLFCNAGRLLDERLEALGGTRMVDRVDVDGVYTQAAEAWTTDVVKLLAADRANSAPAVVVNAPESHSPDHAEQRRERSHALFKARVVVNRLLTTAESDNEVRDYEVDLSGAEIAYSAGDSIAVHATNDPVLVDAILAELGVEPDREVAGYDEPLGTLLAH
jgi:sulfite reductase (NADPH) flavoprotein alpha-component